MEIQENITMFSCIGIIVLILIALLVWFIYGVFYQPDLEEEDFIESLWQEEIKDE